MSPRPRGGPSPHPHRTTDPPGRPPRTAPQGSRSRTAGSTRPPWVRVRHPVRLTASGARDIRSPVRSPVTECGLPEKHDEAYLPAEQHQASAYSWLSGPDEDPRWSFRALGAPSEGPRAPLRDVSRQEALTPGARRSEGFPRASRIRVRSSFLAVQRGGRRVTSRDLVTVYLPAAGPLRVGFTVSRKVGNAVVRNRVKRRLREAVRRSGALIAMRDLDVVFIARGSAAAASAHDLADQVRTAFAQIARLPRAARPSTEV